ncbi:MAG TPA: DUF2207 domain-containing protein [Acidimicrobiales bacterium]|nr:DUF2207 domain-containing protein [Acidimicrobiales bacterium]
MRSRTHRRVDIALVALGVVAAGVAAAIGAGAGDPERVVALWIGAEIGDDGIATVVEVIDYDFGTERRHGIYRDVPDLPANANVVAHSSTAPDDVAVFATNAAETRIQIGDPNRTISGRHRYTIEYQLDTFASEGGVAADTVGTSWSVRVEDVEVHVVTPVRLEEIECFRGEVESERRCSARQVEPGHLEVRVDRLGKREGVTVRAAPGGPIDPPALPAPPSGAIDDPGTGLLPPIAVAALAALLAAVPTSVLIRRAGRERVAVGGAATAAWGGEDGPERHVLRDSDDLAELATVEFTPPDELSPAQGGVLLTESISPDHKTAWLVQAAIDGYVDLDEDGSEVTLVRRDRQDDGRTAAILDQAFAGRDRLRLGKYDPSFAEAWEAVGGELSNWQRASGLWDPAGDRRKTHVRVVGILVVIVGLAGTGLAAWPANRHGPVWLVPVAVAALLAGAGWTAVVRGWELRVRSMKGSALWLRVESFRRFLADSESRHAEEAAKLGVLREYTSWAVAVGEVERWSRAVQSAGLAVADSDAIRYASIAPLLSSATSGTSTAPSSSGGGGGVGSGGGGGGGGSW